MGLFHNVWENDNSYLSFVILGLFYAMTGWCGVVTWKIDACYAAYYASYCKDKGSMELKDEVTRAEDIGWFASDQCLTIGMIGTVWGFIMMLKGFSGFGGDNNAIQKLMDFIVSGMGTALYTTFAGLICSMLLKIQYFNISHAIAKLPTMTVADLFGQKPKCNKGGCCKKKELNPYYTSQDVIGEKTPMVPGDSSISRHGLIRFPVVPGTVNGQIYRKIDEDVPVLIQSFSLSASNSFDNELIGDVMPEHYVTGAKLIEDIGVIELTWNTESPGPNMLKVNYQYELGE
jgi:hypothetical protein